MGFACICVDLQACWCVDGHNGEFVGDGGACAKGIVVLVGLMSNRVDASVGGFV